jgi:hypothetical protein
VANILPNAAAFIALALGSGRVVADSEITISTAMHMAGTDAAPFLRWLSKIRIAKMPSRVQKQQEGDAFCWQKGGRALGSGLGTAFFIPQPRFQLAFT